jgi:hypothetical protein
MARIKLTRSNRFILYFLEFYVVAMLVLILVRFLQIL